ncbi:unnamed protein product [Gordionus sp. m RMFG-2023]|uniref:RNA-binding motif protein, X-linked 2-like n=1 Tax=Gordionus sp. m RMFG-2023 TaxID=3053472 RepID=UPI0030E4B8BC
MNPLTNIRNINKLNEIEERLGIKSENSWHQQYKNSAYIFVGGFSYELTEGDLISVFSQYGEILDINLVRDKKTGKSNGFCFICYEDQRSTILAVDNFNGIKLLGRTIKVDHVSDYRRPKDTGEEDTTTLKLRLEGIGPESQLIKDMEEDKRKDIDILPMATIKQEPEDDYNDQAKHTKRSKKCKTKRTLHSPNLHSYHKKSKKDPNSKGKKHKNNNKHKHRSSNS